MWHQRGLSQQHGGPCWTVNKGDVRHGLLQNVACPPGTLLTPSSVQSVPVGSAPQPSAPRVRSHGTRQHPPGQHAATFVLSGTTFMWLLFPFIRLSGLSQGQEPRFVVLGRQVRQNKCLIKKSMPTPLYKRKRDVLHFLNFYQPMNSENDLKIQHRHINVFPNYRINHS